MSPPGVLGRDDLSPSGANCARPTYVGEVSSDAREPGFRRTFGCGFGAAELHPKTLKPRNPKYNMSIATV